MSTTTIQFNVYAAEDPWNLETKRPIAAILPGPWAEIDGEGPEIAERAIVSWFADDHDGWEDYFGNDLDGTAIVEIIEPAINAGFYRVELERTIKARAERIEDPRCPTKSA